MKIDDTYCEAFDGLYSGIIVTAKDEDYLKKAAFGAPNMFDIPRMTGRLPES